MKRGGGRRFYRPEDVELLKGIHHLLHEAGYTIKGVQKIIRDSGVDAVKLAVASGARAPRAGSVAGRSRQETLTQVIEELEACLAIARGQDLPRASARPSSKRA